MKQRIDMIRELRIQNFLSLEDVDVSFGKMNIFVGPNASGKSNIVKALMFIKNLMNKDTEHSCKTLGLKSLKNMVYNFEEERTIRFNILLSIKSKDLQYEIEIDPKTGGVEKETIKFPGMEKPLLNRKGMKMEYLTNVGDTTTREAVFGWTVFSSLPRNSHPLLIEMRKFLEGFSAYSFDPYKMRSMSPPGFNLELERDGSNLAQVLHSLLTYSRKDKFIPIEKTIRDLIPEIEEIDVPLTESGDHVYLALREHEVPEPIEYTNISDGTLRIIAFVTALHLKSSVIAFEEPENCVHPHLFETVIHLCRNLTPCQIIITTHSPYLVDKAEVEELRLVMKKEGRTEVSEVKDREKNQKVA